MVCLFEVDPHPLKLVLEDLFFLSKLEDEVPLLGRVGVVLLEVVNLKGSNSLLGIHGISVQEGLAVTAGVRQLLEEILEVGLQGLRTDLLIGSGLFLQFFSASDHLFQFLLFLEDDCLLFHKQLLVLRVSFLQFCKADLLIF